MSHDSTLATTTPAARKALAAMSKPEGMTNTTWRSVYTMLTVIVDHYPRSCPSQVRIAAIMGASERSVHTWVAAAQTAGLLHVQANVGAKPKRRMGHFTNRYLIILPPSGSEKQAETACHEYSYGVHNGTPSLNPAGSGSKSFRPAAESRPSNVISMTDWDDERSRNVGTPAVPPLRRSKWASRAAAAEIVTPLDSERRGEKRPPRPPDEIDRLIAFFCGCWEQMQLEHQMHKDTRPIETAGQCRKYIRLHFKNHDEMEVRRMMREFVVAVSKMDITVKPGQSAWMCFTGAWGRQRHVQIGDPYAAYRKEKK